MSLLTLPWEIKSRIFKLTGKYALKNLSQCSSEYHEELKHVLWDSVYIDFGITPLNQWSVKNLAYAKCLSMEFPNDLWRECVQITCKNFQICIDHCSDSLKKLSMFNCGAADLSRKFLTSLKKLRNLQEVYIGKTKMEWKPLTYTLIKAFGGVPSLKILTLRSVKLDKNPRMFSEGFSNLTILKISSSAVTDPVLSRIKNLAALEVLEMNHTLITHVVLEGINGLPNLKELDVSNCRKLHSIPPLTGLPSLRKLNLTCTPIKDDSMINIAALPKLEDLCIHCCKNISVTGIQCLYGMKSLRFLRCWDVLYPAAVVHVVTENLKHCIVEHSCLNY